MKNLKVSYKDKDFYFNRFDVYSLKRLNEYFYGSYFFSRETLKFFGQTLKNSYLYKEKEIYKDSQGNSISCYILKIWSSKTNNYKYYYFADENHEKPFYYLGVK
ncbi:MAG: hypothetical protein GX873_02775 [Parcubacteria group bacterium]|nr:hypothetical protein [Parcubacteria group bacterium]